MNGGYKIPEISFGEVCEHSFLKRSCEICELEIQLSEAKLEAMRDRHSRDVMEVEYKRMRDALKRIANADFDSSPGPCSIAKEALSSKPEGA